MRTPHALHRLARATAVVLAVWLATAPPAPAAAPPPAPAASAAAPSASVPFAPHAPADDPPPPVPDGLVLTDRIGGHVGGVAVAGDEALTSHGFRVHAYDLSDPSAPRLVRSGPSIAGRPSLLPGNLARMVRRGAWTYGLMDWDRAVGSDETTRVRLVVLDPHLNLAGSLDLPGDTSAGPTGIRARALELAAFDERHLVIADSEAGDDHVRLIDVSRPAAPVMAGDTPAGGAVSGLAVSGGFAYAVTRDRESGDRFLSAIDVASPSTPRPAARVLLGDRAETVTAGDGHAFVASCENLAVYSLADPGAPALIGQVDLATPPTPVPGPGPTPTPEPTGDGRCAWTAAPTWRDGLLYVVTTESVGFFEGRTVVRVFDVRRPAAPLLLGQTRFPGATDEFAVGDGVGVVASMTRGMGIVDLARPDQPRSRGPLIGGRRITEALAAEPGLVVQGTAFGFESELTFVVPGQGIVSTLDLGALNIARAIAVRSGWAYVITQRSVGDGEERRRVSEARVVAARAPAAPRDAGRFPAVGTMSDLAVDGDRLWVADMPVDGEGSSEPGALRVFDISDAGRPSEISRVAGSFLSVAAGGGRAFAGTAEDPPRVRAYTLVLSADGPVLTEVASLTLSAPALALTTAGGRLFVRDAENRLHVADAEDPAGLRWRGTLDLAEWGEVHDPVVRGDVVYAGGYDSLETIDVRDPAAPRSLGVRAIPGVGQIASQAMVSVATGGFVVAAGWEVYAAGDLTGLWVFGAGTPPGFTEGFEGLYWANFEHSRFAPGGRCPREGDEWFLFAPSGSDFEARYRALYPTYRDSGPAGRSGWAWARFEGSVSPPAPARFPHWLDRAVTVTRVVDMWALPSCGYAPRPGERVWLPWGRGG